MTAMPSVAWSAAGLASGGAAALPCLPLEAAGLHARVRHILSAWLYRRRPVVAMASPPIEAILDELGTGGWRIRRDAARAIAHIFATVQPAGILEFGSGISTVVFATLAQACERPVRIVSIEENPEYADKTRRLLCRYGVAAQATVIEAAVEACTLDGWRGFTYRPDEQVVADAFGPVRPDLLFIDGPASWRLRRHDCRYGTLLVARRYAAAQALFIADDAFRRREQTILKRWGELDGVDVLGMVPVGRGLGIGVVQSPRSPAPSPG